MQSVRSRQTDAATKFNAQAAPAIGNEVKQEDVEQLNAKVRQVLNTQKQVIDQVLRNAKESDDTQVQLQTMQDQLNSAHSEIRKLKNEKTDPVASGVAWFGLGMAAAAILFTFASKAPQAGELIQRSSISQEQIR